MSPQFITHSRAISYQKRSYSCEQAVVWNLNAPRQNGDPPSESLPSLRLEPTLSTQALHASSNSDMKLSSRSTSIAMICAGSRAGLEGFPVTIRGALGVPSAGPVMLEMMEMLEMLSFLDSRQPLYSPSPR